MHTIFVALMIFAIMIFIWRANAIIDFFERFWRQKTCEHRWDQVQRTARLTSVKLDEKRTGFRKDIVFSTMCEHCGKLKRWKANRDD